MTGSFRSGGIDRMNLTEQKRKQNAALYKCTFVVILLSRFCLRMRYLRNIQEKADKDLCIILILMAIAFFVFIVYGNAGRGIWKDLSIDIWLHFILQVLLQFGLTGTGCVIVMLYRKEYFRNDGPLNCAFYRQMSCP